MATIERREKAAVIDMLSRERLPHDSGITVLEELWCSGIAFILWWRWLSASRAEEQKKVRAQARVYSFVNAIQ